MRIFKMHYDYRNDFPLLMQNKIIYIDNAATSQRPQCVIDAEGDFYKITTQTLCADFTL